MDALKIESFPVTVHIRLQSDADRPILIAGHDVDDCLGQVERAAVGVYRLEKLLEVERRITQRRIGERRQGKKTRR